MKLWQRIKHLLRSKKPYFLTGWKKHDPEAFSGILDAEVEAKKKQNQRKTARLMKRINKLEARLR